jgi:hypothetical protein
VIEVLWSAAVEHLNLTRILLSSLAVSTDKLRRLLPRGGKP